MDTLCFVNNQWIIDHPLWKRIRRNEEHDKAAIEVPQISVIHNSSSVASYKTSKSYISLKKTRIEVQNDDDDDDDEYFSVPDLG